MFLLSKSLQNSGYFVSCVEKTQPENARTARTVVRIVAVEAFRPIIAHSVVRGKDDNCLQKTFCNHFPRLLMLPPGYREPEDSSLIKAFASSFPASAELPATFCALLRALQPFGRPSGSLELLQKLGKLSVEGLLGGLFTLDVVADSSRFAHICLLLSEK